MKVDKIHLLIHPGFLQNNHEADLEYERSIDASEASKSYNAYLQELLLRYLDIVEEINDNELLIVLLPESARGMAHRMKKSSYENDPERMNYIGLLQYLRSFLGRRMIALTQYENQDDENGEGKSKIMSDGELYGKLDRILRKRGFEFDSHVLVEACGESLKACIEAEAAAFHEHYDLEYPVLIDTDKTDYDIAEHNPYADANDVTTLKDNMHTNKRYRYK